MAGRDQGGDGADSSGGSGGEGAVQQRLGIAMQRSARRGGELLQQAFRRGATLVKREVGEGKRWEGPKPEGGQRDVGR